MAHLWIEDIPGEWAILPLATSRVVLPARTLGTGRFGEDATAPPLVLVRAQARSTWHVIAPPDAPAWVNGLPIVHGLRELRDRDEIRTATGETFYYSGEELAQVEPMPPTPNAMSCPRCREVVAVGSPAVRCPHCALWYHQSDHFPCWTYAETCAMCPHPTALDAGYQWTPVEL
jgi:hypothetical protein